MSKVLKLLQEKKSKFNCNCITRMNNMNSNSFEIFEKILEENKEKINFVFVNDSDKSNEYANFINKYTEVTDAMCLECLWYVITNYNDIPIGDEILCYN